VIVVRRPDTICSGARIIAVFDVDSESLISDAVDQSGRDARGLSGPAFAYYTPMKRMRIIALAIIFSGLLMSWADSKETYAAEPTHLAVSAAASSAASR
jgi:hypothetical protein